MDSKEIINEINGGKYNRTITKSLSNPPLHSPLVFTAQAEKYDNLIIVKSQWTKSDLNAGLKALQTLGDLLIGDHAEGVEKRKKEITALIETEREEIEKARKTMEDNVKKSVKLHSNQISALQERILLQKQILEVTKIRQTALAEDLKKANNVLGDIIAQRDSLLRDGKNMGSEFLPEHEAAIRTSQLRLDQIQDKVFSAKKREQEILSKIRMAGLEIQSCQQAIKDVEIEQNNQLQEKTKILEEKIEKLSATRASISNIKIIRQPEAAAAPVKSSRGKKIVMLSGVVALFMLIFLAFLLEYIKNARREYLSRKEQT